MAELRVQPKKKTAWWPILLIAVLIIAAILYFTVFKDGVRDGDATRNATDSTTVIKTPATQ